MGFLMGLIVGGCITSWIMEQEYSFIIEEHSKYSEKMNEMKKTLKYYQDYINSIMLKK